MNILYLLFHELRRENVFGLKLIIPHSMFLLLGPLDGLMQKLQCFLVMLGFVLGNDAF